MSRPLADDWSAEDQQHLMLRYVFHLIRSVVEPAARAPHLAGYERSRDARRAGLVKARAALADRRMRQ